MVKDWVKTVVSLSLANLEYSYRNLVVLRYVLPGTGGTSVLFTKTRGVPEYVKWI